MRIELLNEDCIRVLKTIPDNTIDLIVADPPYLIETTGGGMYSNDDKKYIKELNGMNKGFSKEVLEEICRVMKKINCYIFCSQKQIISLLDFFVKEKKCNWNLITWHKTNPIPACGNKYLTDTEYLLFFREKGVKVYGEYGTKFTYYTTPLNTKDKKEFNHPTVKPLQIVENLIINSTKENEIVLDPFMGSGTTGVACVKHNRNFIGIELNKEYFETASNRIEQTRKEKPNA